MSSYNPNQPQNLPPPAIGVQAIQENFSTYSTVFDNNHLALNLGNQGKHTNVILQEQSTDPSVDGSFSALYGKSVVAASATFQGLFAKIPQFLTDDKPNNPMQLTFNVVNTTGAPFYQSFLPGGYLLYFGSIASANIVNTQITLVPTPSKILCVIPNPTKVAGVGLLPSRPVQIAVTVNNASQFTINSSFPTGTGIIRWLAICKQ